MKTLAILAMVFSIFGGKWDWQSRFTVIDTRSGIRVASFDPWTKEGVRLTFPQNWIIGGGEKGEWLAQKAGRVDLVARELGVLEVEDKLKMSWGDRLAWWWWGSRVKWREIDAGAWMRREQTVDGIEVWRLDETWRAVARELWTSTAVVEERLAVTVVNLTSESGLAAKVADIVENAGMRVVAAQTGEEKMQGCEAVSSKQSKSKIGVRLLMRALGCKWRMGNLGENEVELLLGQR